MCLCVFINYLFFLSVMDIIDIDYDYRQVHWL